LFAGSAERRRPWRRVGIEREGEQNAVFAGVGLGVFVLSVVGCSWQKYVVYIVAMVSFVVEHVERYKGKTNLYALRLPLLGKHRA